MQYEVSEAEMNDAKHPHEIFLINLITNHILVFVGLIGFAKTYPWVMLITPGVSIVVLGYIMLRARSKFTTASWYAACHWQLCARRGMLFIGMLMALGLVVVGLLLSVGGDATQLKPGHYAFGGVAALPTLVFILVLIVMESDAMHKAKSGVVPQWLIDKYPSTKKPPTIGE